MMETRHLNEAVHFLTAVSIILATVGTVAAWWGMNIDSMKDLALPGRLPLGYLAGLVVVGALVMLEIAYFARKSWLFRRRRRQ